MPIGLLIRDSLDTSQLDLDAIEGVMIKAIEGLGRDPEETEVSILITGDDEMAGLNFDYRGEDGPTDVLSFALLEGEGGDLQPNMLGDIVISLDTMARQAHARGWSLDLECHFLLLPGLLHVVGLNHGTPKEALIMEVRTQGLWLPIHPDVPLPQDFLKHL